jgi:hypothetical protein
MQSLAREALRMGFIQVCFARHAEGLHDGLRMPYGVLPRTSGNASRAKELFAPDTL